jgi:hypothetical protein
LPLLAKPVAQFPLTTALVDLNNYYTAGTLEGALIGIQKQTGLKDDEASKKLMHIATSRFHGDDPNTTIILNWLFPGYYATTDTGQRVDKNGKTIPMNSANLKALNNWLAKDADGQKLNMGLFLDGDYAPVRERAIKELQIN